MNFFRKIFFGIIFNSLAILLCQALFNNLLNDFYFQGDFSQLLILALVITLVNFFIKPILRLIFLPFIWITLGLFSFVINIIILKLVTCFTASLLIQLPLTWLAASMILSIFNSLIHKL